MASSLEIFLINSFRCQDSKRDHFGKKLMRHFLTGSLSVADRLQKWSPFSTHPCITPFAMWPCSSSHASWNWASLVIYLGQQNEVEGTLCQFSRSNPQGLRTSLLLHLLLYLCHESTPRQACWVEIMQHSWAQLLQVMLMYMMRNQKQDWQILLVDQ